MSYTVTKVGDETRVTCNDCKQGWQYPVFTGMAHQCKVTGKRWICLPEGVQLPTDTKQPAGWMTREEAMAKMQANREARMDRVARRRRDSSNCLHLLELVGDVGTCELFGECRPVATDAELGENVTLCRDCPKYEKMPSDADDEA